MPEHLQCPARLPSPHWKQNFHGRVPWGTQGFLLPFIAPACSRHPGLTNQAQNASQRRATPSSHSTSQSSSFTFSPPAPRCKLCFPYRTHRAHTGCCFLIRGEMPPPLCARWWTWLSHCLSNPSNFPALTEDRNASQALPNGPDTDNSYKH